MSEWRIDLRKDIAELCVIDCTAPPSRDNVALRWVDGDRFTNAKGHKYKWSYVIAGWRRVD